MKKKEEKKKEIMNAEVQDAREFVEMYSQLNMNERLQVKGVLIGLKLAAQKPEVVNA